MVHMTIRLQDEQLASYLMLQFTVFFS